MQVRLNVSEEQPGSCAQRIPFSSRHVLAQVTELLYLKQTQLERMAAEKAAQQMALERELSVAREEAARVQRCGAPMPSRKS